MADTTISTETTSGPDVKNTVAFLNRFFPVRRNFAIRLWEGTVLSSQHEARFTLVFNAPGALRRMFRIPLELSLAEAFIRNDYDIEGDIFAAFEPYYVLPAIIRTPGDALTLFRLWRALPPGNAAKTITRGPAQLANTRHSKARDSTAIQYHYDVGNEFYELWLDKRMIYSCAYFPTGAEDLDTAQERKLDLICQKLDLQPDDNLLDIGCGWGALVIYAAQKYGLKALGVTLSEEQQHLATQRIADAGLSDRVEVKLLDYRDVSDGLFDKVVSVGMYEHVGKSHLPEYFAQVRRLLKPGGLFLNHGIGIHPRVNRESSSLWGRAVERFIMGVGSFVERYIFPDGELVPVNEVNLLAEDAGFELRHVENLREHYALTLRHWVSRLEAQHDAARQFVDESVYRTWRLFMTVAAFGFESDMLNVNQSVLVRPANPHSFINK